MIWLIAKLIFTITLLVVTEIALYQAFEEAAYHGRQHDVEVFLGVWLLGVVTALAFMWS